MVRHWLQPDQPSEPYIVLQQILYVRELLAVLLCIEKGDVYPKPSHKTPSLGLLQVAAEAQLFDRCR